ncbi:MAG TPA: DUF4870 domain-containing protein [Ktedonobacteraceae bacterium]|jgi:uncharacterized membrane protein|nr:DUF4870 domain-containing protein [Ktedonobacteraceae bacterium]
MSRSRTISRGTTLGLDERLESILIYAVSLIISLFLPLGWLPGLIIYFIEKNRNVRVQAGQSAIVFGVLSVLYFVVHLLQHVFGLIPILGGVLVFGLGLLASIIMWVMIILAVYLIIMVWFRPNYRLPVIGRYLGSGF